MPNNGSKPADSNLMSGLHQNMFGLNSISNQYVKGIDLASLHESLNRAQTTLEESQNIRVKQLFSMTNNESIAKSFVENQNGSKNQNNLNSSTNDRNNNNNKCTSVKEKNEAALQFKEFDSPAEKPSQSVHTNSKSGVSLKCAYCEAREDFKSRWDVVEIIFKPLNPSTPVQPLNPCSTPDPFDIKWQNYSMRFIKLFLILRTELENHMKIQHNIAAKHKCSICDEILPSPAGKIHQFWVKNSSH